MLRLKPSDRLIVLDGKGQTWLAEIFETSVRLLEPLRESSELPIKVTLMVALPKNGFDEVVRACTELGVNRIIPLLTHRCLVNPSSHKLERWRKIATEAVEQCERQIVPIIEEPRQFVETITKLSRTQTNCYICVTRREVEHLLCQLRDRSADEMIIAIGPEGGWTEEEIDQAIAANFLPVSLGKRILRTITAPLVALAIIDAYLET